MPSKSYAKPYLCVGGPLDGKYVKSTDFYGARNDYSWDHRINRTISTPMPPGIHHRYREEYQQFNNGSGGKREHSMIWVHVSLLPKKER